MLQRKIREHREGYRPADPLTRLLSEEQNGMPSPSFHDHTRWWVVWQSYSLRSKLGDFIACLSYGVLTQT